MVARCLSAVAGLLAYPSRWAPMIDAVRRWAGAVVKVQLGRGFRPDQAGLVTKRLLALRYVDGLETAHLDEDEEEMPPGGTSVANDFDVPVGADGLNDSPSPRRDPPYVYHGRVVTSVTTL